MNYVQSNLMHGEKVVYEGKIHWFVFFPSVVVFLLGLTMLLSVNDLSGVFVLFIIVSLALAVNAFLKKISTELVVTNKRVIAKFGFIRRNTIELSHSKVESLNVDQGVFGRILNFGTLSINGTGGQKAPIPKISQPLDFRKMAFAAIEKGQQVPHKLNDVNEEHSSDDVVENKPDVLIEALPNDSARPGILLAKCTKCAKIMTYREQLRGKQVKCPQCSIGFALP